MIAGPSSVGAARARRGARRRVASASCPRISSSRRCSGFEPDATGRARPARRRETRREHRLGRGATRASRGRARRATSASAGTRIATQSRARRSRCRCRRDFDVERCREWRGEGYAVLAAARHGRKLRPGFAPRQSLRAAHPRAAGRAGRDGACLRRRSPRHGVPNYFGPQRFGRDGANLRRALEWAQGGEAPRDRQQRGFVLSAARSFLFNAVLAARVRRGDWNRLLPGEAVMLDGRRSFFHAATIDATLEQRCRDMDVHPSGPLPGRGESPATDAALEVEREALAGHDALVALLARERMEHERRSLRLPVREFDWAFEARRRARAALHAAARHVRDRRAARTAGRRVGRRRGRGRGHSRISEKSGTLRISSTSPKISAGARRSAACHACRHAKRAAGDPCRVSATT